MLSAKWWPSCRSLNVLSQITATGLKIAVSPTGAQSSNDLLGLNFKIGHQDNSSSGGHQGDIPYCFPVYLFSQYLSWQDIVIKFEWYYLLSCQIVSIIKWLYRYVHWVIDFSL